jgi:hypothetical protein
MVEPRPVFTHRWRSRRVMGQYFGKLCRIVPTERRSAPNLHGVMGEDLIVEFQDGVRITTRRGSIRSTTPIGFSRP